MLSPTQKPVTCLFQAIQQFDTLDHKTILQNVAENYPLGFEEACMNTGWPTLKALETSNEPLVPVYMLKVAEHASKNERVSAIKLIRQYTGMGLKEAKDALDLACPFGQHGVGVTPAQVSTDWANDFAGLGLSLKYVAPLEPTAPICRMHPGELSAFVVVYSTASGRPEVHGTFQRRADAERALDSVQDNYGNGYIHQTFITLVDPI